MASMTPSGAPAGLTLVGVGPGDPQLLTVAAVQAIEAAAVVAYPVAREGAAGMAATIAAPWIRAEHRRLPLLFPMVSEAAPRIDILIDDGGHEPEQQRVTLEEMLPHLSPGGVYLCEDIHGDTNVFSAYLQGLATSLNAMSLNPTADGRPGLSSETTAFQKAIHSMHLYIPKNWDNTKQIHLLLKTNGQCAKNNSFPNDANVLA